MTKKQFVAHCIQHCTGIMRMAASFAEEYDRYDEFISDLIQQDLDTPEGTLYHIGEELYNELQKFK